MSKHIMMGYEIDVLTIRFRLDDILAWWHSRTVDPRTGDLFTDTAADLGMVGYNHFDGDDLDWEMADWEEPTRNVDRSDTSVHTNGDLNMTIRYTSQMTATQNPSIDLVDIIHSWMIDCLGDGASPKKEEWQDMTVFADLCDYERRIVGFYPSKHSMEAKRGYMFAGEDIWVEVEWITSDHRAQMEANQDAAYNRGVSHGEMRAAAKYRGTGVFGWQCLVSNCAAINLFTGDVLSTDWHDAEAWCRQCKSANVLVSQERWSALQSDTSHDAGFDHNGTPYTQLIPLLMAT